MKSSSGSRIAARPTTFKVGLSEPLRHPRAGGRAIRLRRPHFAFARHPVFRAGFAGLALRASLSPTETSAGIVIGLTIALISAYRRNFAMHIAIGCCAGLTWHTFVAVSTVEWGLTVATLAWITPALIVTFAFGIYYVLLTLIPYENSHFNFAIAWAIATTVGDHVGAPVALSVGMINTDVGRWLIYTFGVSGADAVISIFAASCALWLTKPMNRRMLSFAFVTMILPVMLFVISRDAPRSQPSISKLTWIHAIDPQIPSANHRRARFSLHERNQIERHVDGLTQEALELENGIIVLPEGGNGLFNLRIPRRRAALGRLIRGKKSHLLYSTHDFDERANHYNSIAHISSAGVMSMTHKSRTVPIAERHLRSGAPNVLSINGKRIGLAICYDSVFHSHVAALRDEEADIMIVVADDASFGRTWLPNIHLLYSRIRALEARMSLVFLSNMGPVASFDSNGVPIPAVRSSDGFIYSYAIPDLRPAEPSTKQAAAGSYTHFALAPMMLLLFGLTRRMAT